MPEAERDALRRTALAYVPRDRASYATPNYETQQPPLAYALAVPALRVLPRATIVWRLFTLRALSVGLASCAVPLAFLFFRRLFRREAAVAATLAFVAYPGPATFTGRFTNDGLAFPLAAALLLVLSDVAAGTLTRKKTILLATLLAAGAWTKLYFLPLFAAPPLAALFAPGPMRWASLRRAAAASALALLFLTPWLVHQHSDTGDWLGLAETKQVRRSGASLATVAAAALPAVSPSFAGAFVRSNIFPGAWAATGAPRVPASLAVCGILALLAAFLARGARSPTARRRWIGASTAAMLFLAAQVIHAATLAAAFRWRIEATEGWYSLILLPVVIAVPAVFAGTPGSRAWIASAGLFLLADLTCTFGVLPAAYAGVARLGARSPFSSYAGFLFSPAAAFDSYARVGLLGWPPLALGALAAAWLAALAAAFIVAIRLARAH
jgi:hypothetical protein